MDDIESAKQLVKERIKGTRKGTDVPTYTHSWHVFDILKEYGYDDQVCLAGLLHDIVEDGATSLTELKDLGYSDRVVELVDLCSHDCSIKVNDARWVVMIARLVQKADADAWAIKVADLLDNLRGCHTMPEERARFMKETKVPIMLSVTKELLGETGLWKQLINEIN